MEFILSKSHLCKMLMLSDSLADIICSISPSKPDLWVHINIVIIRTGSCAMITVLSSL